jgi:hypothetical protein
VIDIRFDDDLAVVTFPYDAEAVEIVKSVPMRRYHAEPVKYWSIPTSEWRVAATRFYFAGFDVVVNDDPFTPAAVAPGPARGESPFVALFDLLPEHLRDGAYRALARVLHPDAGGDTRLMQELNRAAGR